MKLLITLLVLISFISCSNVEMEYDLIIKNKDSHLLQKDNALDSDQ